MNASQTKQIASQHRQQGFTLLEMLVTVSILAAVSFIATSALDSAYDDTRIKLTRSEMMEIAKAIKQFKQDTGHYPKEGPFQLLGNDGDNSGIHTCDDDVANSTGGIDPNETIPGFVITQEWFDSPANLMQLLERPVICNNHPLKMLETWNPNTGRGWRGPYLTNNLEFVDIGNALASNGEGDPIELSIIDPSRLEGIRAIADPFDQNPVVPDTGNDCSENIANTTPCLMDWRPKRDDNDSNDSDGDVAFNKYGRPYLYFIDSSDADTNDIPDVVDNIEGCEAVPCLLSMGPNGYIQANGENAHTENDDIVINLE